MNIMKKTKNGSSDLEQVIEVTDNQLPSFHLYTHTYQTTEYWFYLSSVIQEPSHYVDMIHTIRSAGPNDVIYLCLNTPGGRLDTGIQLINAIRSTEAKVISVLEAEAASMGAILFLAADEHIVYDNCRMMFHDFSGGSSSGAKGNEQFKEITAAIQLYNKLMKTVCIPFLSANEVERIIKGEDFWMDTDEIRKRLKNMSRKNETNETVSTPSNKKKPKQKMKTITVVDAEIKVPCEENENCS